MNSLHLILLSCLAVASAAGTGSQKIVKVKVGDDTILPCQLETSYDKKSKKVEWTHNDSDVHLYRKGKDDLTNQDKHFKNRTALFYDEMAKGNISLKLSKVNEQDEGNYTCRVDSSQVTHCNILLSVEMKSNTEERKKAELVPEPLPEPDPDPDPKPEQKKGWEEYGDIVYVVIAVTGTAVVIATVIVGFLKLKKYINNNPVTNTVYEPVPLKERNQENQRDSDMVAAEPEPKAEAKPKAEAEAKAEAKPKAEAEAKAEAEPEAQPVPGPNHDDGTSVNPYRRGHRQNSQGEEQGQTQDNECEEHGKQQ